MKKTASAPTAGKAIASPTFAIAFGGGGARGLAHIHVIEALDELGIRPVAISGSSIGAIMGAGMASGMTGRDIHHYARSVFTNRTELAARLWRSRPGTLAEMMERGRTLAQFNIERILPAFLPAEIPDSFDELGIPLQVTATDYFGHSLLVLDSGELRSALAASAAIPAMFRPVRRDGTLLIDGGFYNPVPFDLVQSRADITIAIDVVGAPEKGARGAPSTMDLMYGASQLMMQSIIAQKLTQSQPDIFLRPPVSRFRALDFLKLEAVMHESHSLKEETKRAIETVVEKRQKG